MLRLLAYPLGRPVRRLRQTEGRSTQAGAFCTGQQMTEHLVPRRRSQQFTVLAVASGGGHWEELMLLRPAFEDERTVFATTNRELAARDGVRDVRVLPDSNRDEPRQALWCMIASARLIWRVRPNLLVTTGALPGLFCLIFARLLGARTIWVDSIANSDRPSLSGACARLFATRWYTQWKHLESATRRYEGALL